MGGLAGPNDIPPEFMQQFDLEEIPDDTTPEAHPTMAALDLYRKLIQVQTTLHAPKNQVNSFGGFNYRSCEDILTAVKPLLAQQGLTLFLSDEVVNVGVHNYVKATATILDEAGEVIRSTALAREADDKKGMDPSQMTGTASSYARKYALNGLFLIDDTKDADSNENTAQRQQVHQEYQQQRQQTREQATPPRQQYNSNGNGQQAAPKAIKNPGDHASERQVEFVQSLAKRAKYSDEDLDGLIFDQTNGSEQSVADLTKGGASSVIEYLQAAMRG